jgi:threonylcarbamoyladenosine tRNA methylthiotransferase MtaB
LLKAAVFNLGCKVNQYESDRIAAELSSVGFEVSPELDYADLYVINTCAVTAEAERKSRQAVARARKFNPAAKIAVVGCASQNDTAQFAAKEGVVFVSGAAGKSKFAKIALELFNSNDKAAIEEVSPFTSVFEEGMLPARPRTRAYIMVQDGCDNFCSYCIVPYLRGRGRSRSVESVLKEADALSDVKEVVLIGINLSAYGRDIGSSLASLLAAFKPYGFRLRLGSLEPNVVTEEFLSAAAALKNFCPHFHLSLQSGDADVLKAMNRRYTPEVYKEKTELIRAYFKDAAVTTDVIAGFPAETEEHFWNGYEFVKNSGITDAHCFPYSPRKGTKAAELKELPHAVTERRAFLLAELAAQLKYEFMNRFIGCDAEVLFEDAKDGYVRGYTKNYLRVYSASATPGETVTVKLKEIRGDGLLAE